MRYGFLASAALAALVATAPVSFAFEVQRAPTNANGSTKFTDPDDVSDGMAANLAGDNTASGSALHFGGGATQFSGGSSTTTACRRPCGTA